VKLVKAEIEVQAEVSLCAIALSGLCSVPNTSMSTVAVSDIMTFNEIVVEIVLFCSA